MAERTARWRWVKVAQPRPWRPGSEVSILTTTRRTSRGAVKMVRMDRMVKGAMALPFTRLLALVPAQYARPGIPGPVAEQLAGPSRIDQGFPPARPPPPRHGGKITIEKGIAGKIGGCIAGHDIERLVTIIGYGK